ncbi:MAG TPA: hypothetical protein VE935_18805 [Burkholderiales bacterium]|jgi:hypothetical protein|nr:hypothetical protein [Burkholderiales bacterium]
MPAAPRPFRLLTPAQFAMLTAEEKADYLSRLTFDIQKHMRQVQESNKRLVNWILQKNGVDGGK